MVSKHRFRLKGENAEKLVQELAAKSFLVDWCFPSPKLPDGKELCDLLVVFDDVAIIWQIKDLQLDQNGRYRKAEVEKNMRQLIGARRHLCALKRPLVLHNPRRIREECDAGAIKRVFLISVLMGEGESILPFVDETKKRTIHVFTRAFVELVLGELDTISDFVTYLIRKEEFLRANKSIIISGGEEELLANYLLDNRSFHRLAKADAIYLEGGAWEHLQGLPEYRARNDADQISCVWDEIINRAHEGSCRYERVARELARPTRFERRFLSKVFIEAGMVAHRDVGNDLYRRILSTEGTTYCFLFMDDAEPRERRRLMLEAICVAARGMFLDNARVIGIAREKTLRPTCSYDFCLMEIPSWTQEQQAKMEELRVKAGIFVNAEVGHSWEDEYPSSSR